MDSLKKNNNMEEIKPVPLEEVEQQNKKEEIKEGRAARKWSMCFFVFACIMLLVVAGTIVLPVVIMLFGIVSALCWICFILAGSVFTLGMIWLSDGVKAFNKGWMAFNDTIFNAGNTIYKKVLPVVPILVIIGSVFFLSTWLFMIIGRIKDKNRKKYYTGMIIALSVLTVLFIGVAVVTMIAHNNQ